MRRKVEQCPDPAFCWVLLGGEVLAFAWGQCWVLHPLLGAFTQHCSLALLQIAVGESIVGTRVSISSCCGKDEIAEIFLVLLEIIYFLQQ